MINEPYKRDRTKGAERNSQSNWLSPKNEIDKQVNGHFHGKSVFYHSFRSKLIPQELGTFVDFRIKFTNDICDMFLLEISRSNRLKYNEGVNSCRLRAMEIRMNVFLRLLVAIELGRTTEC